MKLGGMGIIFADSAKTEHQNPRKIAESLTKLHLEESIEDNINRDQLIISRKKNCSIIQKKLLSLIIDLPTNKIRLNKINQGCIYAAINSTTKRRRIQFIETRRLGSSEDTIWMAIITLTQ